MGVSLKQASLGGGILSPNLLGRTDVAKYSVGLRTCTNAIITRYGALENRSGTQYTGTVHFPTFTDRLIKFVFNNDVAYLLEFSGSLIIPYRNGARISTVGAPAYAGGTLYVVGNVVSYAGATYVCQLATGGIHLPTDAMYWILLVGDVLVIPSGIGQSYLFDLQTVQQNDVMTIVEQAIYPQILSRFSDTQWTMAPFTASTGIDPPTGLGLSIGVGPSPSPAPPTTLTAVGGDGGLTKSQYKVTAYWETTGEGSVSNTAIATVGRATGALPVTLNWVAPVGFISGYVVYKLNPGLPGAYGILAIIDSGTTSYVDSGALTSGAEATVVKQPPSNPVGNITFTYVVTAVDATTGAESVASAEVTGIGNPPTTLHPNVITWGAVANAIKYNIYRIISGVPGFIGTANDPTTTFEDNNIIPDEAIQPPTVLPLFGSTDDYPSVVGYYQQRLGFANTINNPAGIKFSRVGQFANFSVSVPIQDDDAIDITVAGQRNEGVQHLIDLGKLIVHTAGSEFVATGNNAGAITPLAVGLVRQGSAGSSYIPPLVLGNTDIFIQARGGFVRDLRYEIQSTSYAGKDLTVYAPDLLANRTIVSMDWQQIPQAIIWIALDDGTLLGLTYLREQDMWAWHRHEFTNGFVEQVCVVPESTQDVVYLTIRRTINGSVTRYIERLADRSCQDTVFYSDSVFADCSLTYDGRNTGSHTITATLGTGWTPTDTLTLTASASTFVSGDVGNQIVFQQIDAVTGLVTDFVSFQILAYTSATVVTVKPLRTVPTWAQATALTTWGKAVKHFTGIGHLEGQNLSILGDGNVIANPLDSAYPLITVASGAFDIPEPALVVTAGLPIQMDVQTLPIENANGETIINKHINVVECCPVFYNSRGGSFGQDFNHLKKWKQPRPASAPMGYPVQPYTGPARIPIQGTPQITGQVAIRNTDPTPFAMSAIVVSGDVGNG